MSTRISPSRTRRRKETRAADLLSAARDVFADKGFAAARLEDVAARAGVSKGTIYLYFESKEVLFRAVVETGMATLVAAVESTRPSATADRPASQRLGAYFRGWQRVLDDIDVGTTLKLLVAESGAFPDAIRRFNEEVVREARSVVVRIVEAGIARGEFRRVRAKTVAELLVPAICLCDMWTLRPPSEQLLDVVLDVLTRGLGAGPPGPPLTAA